MPTAADKKAYAKDKMSGISEKIPALPAVAIMPKILAIPDMAPEK